MSASGFVRVGLPALIVVCVSLQGIRVQTQQRGGTVQTDKVQPVNSGANPYLVIRNWGMEPEGRPWGAANGVAIDRDGMSVWVADRCGNGNGCVGSTVDNAT